MNSSDTIPIQFELSTFPYEATTPVLVTSSHSTPRSRSENRRCGRRNVVSSSVIRLLLLHLHLHLSIWSIELCQQYPDVHFDCFDITADQFPAKNLLPHNISVHEHDAFQAFPEHLRGTYDVVHVQMFLTIVKNGNPAPLIKNFMTLLSM